MFAASKTATVSGAAPDDKFNYVTMLLHGDGTNGAQNNTFLDSSTNNFTITRNGNTTQGSFSPYGSNWSNYFAGANGSPDYFTIPTTTNLNLTGDYTVECWYMQNASGNPTGYGLIFSTTLGIVGANEVGFWIDYPSAGFNWGSLSSAINPVPGTWYHLAATKSGSTTRFFVNGALVASSTTANTPPSGVNWYIGSRPIGSAGGVYSISGNVSNCRIVKGTAIYTSAFTPPTTPLTAVSGTQLLTCQSNRFVDNSSNAYSLTVTGAPSVQRFNPFGTSTAYSTSVIGGSGYFDGTGDYLSTANSSAFAFGTGNFTLEFWYRGTSTTGGFGLLTGGSSGYWQLNLYSGTMYWQDAAGSSNLLNVSASPILNNAWNHVAVVRNSTTTTIYFNGVSVTSATDTTNYSGTGGNFQLGFDSNNNYIAGYIANYRIVKGTAVYTANFTPPTTPLTAISGTSILLNYTNGAIFDNAMMNNLETVGNAQISTSVVKFGTGSIYMAANGDYLAIPSSQNFNFGSGNFTVEMWAYVTTLFDYQQLFTTDGTNAGGASFGIDSAGSPLFYLNDFYFVGPTASITTNTWVHIAFVRSSGVVKAYTNGVGGTGATVTASNAYANPRVGSNLSSSGQNIKGYIDDLRITKGYARYTANFTPPTAAFPDIGPY